jgi:cytochrome b561
MTRYHPILVILHWLLAFAIIGGLITGTFVLSETPNSDPFKLVALKMHMSIGIGILAFMALRLLIRWQSARPPEADIGNAALNRLGSWTHWAFYVLVFAMCLSGLATANLAGLVPIVFGGSGDALPADFSDIAPRGAHALIGKLLVLLMATHIGAFLYHQFVRSDHLFSRMWFGDRTGSGE